MRPCFAVIAVLAVACAPSTRHNDAIESMLSEIAANQRRTAEATLDPRDFVAAADAYEQLEAEVSGLDAHTRWLMADAQLRAGRYALAVDNFEMLIGTPYEDVGVYMAYRTWHLIAFRDGGSQDRVEWTKQPMTLSENAYVDAVARVLSHDFGVVPRGAPDFSSAAARFRPSMLLESAQLLAGHDRLEEARPFFDELLDEHPDSVHARIARGLLQDDSGS